MLLYNLLLLLRKIINYQYTTMKKLVLILGVALSVLACNKTETSSKDFKTAYIDTAELIEKYDKFKDEDDKFKVKSIGYSDTGNIPCWRAATGSNRCPSGTNREDRRCGPS